MKGEAAHLQSLCLRNLKAIRDDSRVESFGNMSIRLFEQFSNQQHHGGGAITRDIILCRRSSSDHNLVSSATCWKHNRRMGAYSRRILYLLFAASALPLRMSCAACIPSLVEAHFHLLSA